MAVSVLADDGTPTSTQATHRLRILIADDDRDTTASLAALLRDEGHDVHTAARGDELLALCSALRPDVVIADIELPGMSGYAVAQEVRQRDGPLAPLLIAISGKWTKTSDKLLGYSVGFDHYLLKPARFRELLAFPRSRRKPSAFAAV